MADSVSSSKSCLVLPGMLRRKRGKISSANSTDQSSTAENIFNPRANNDRQQLLVNTSNIVATDWYTMEEDEIKDIRGDKKSSTTTNKPPAVVTPTTTNSPVGLLSLPTPKDRSHQARRSQNREHGIMHAYDGEIEPEGVRGQEAKVISGAGSKPEISLRSFSKAPATSGILGFLGPVIENDDSTYHEEQALSDWSSLPPPPITPSSGVFRAVSGDNYSSSSSQDLVSMTTSEFTVGQQSVKSSTSGDGGGRRRPIVAPQLRVAEEHAARSVGSEYKPPRKSAPVSVDDSNFEDPQEHVEGIHAMAMEHVMRGEYDMALQAFSQVLTVYLDKYGKSHPMTASAYHNLGTVHSKRAGLLLDNTAHQKHCREQALLCFQAAARSARDAPELGPSHPNVAVSLVRIGFLLLQSQQYQNAVITFREALRIRIDHYGPSHALVANLYNNLGVCHMHMQEFVLGRKYLQQALDIQKDLLGQDEYSISSLLELADTLCNIGGLCLEWVRQQGPDVRHALDGEAACLEALEVRAKVLGENHILTNQVRSLYDMVRSVPLPKVSQSRSSSPGTPTLPTARLARHSLRSIQSDDPEPLELRSSHSDNSRRQDPPGRDHLDRRRPTSPPPSMENQESDYYLTHPPSSVGDHESNYYPTHQTTASASTKGFQTKGWIPPATSMVSDVELNAYEATEENFLLDHSENEDGQMTVISYAQSAASLSSSAQRENERLAYLKQAKAILDVHRDSQTTGQSTNTTPPEYPNHTDIPEDGLVPLGGNWPQQIHERVTPEVLRNPATHLRTIHAGASNFFKRGRYNEALHLLELVVETQRNRNGSMHEDVGSALHNVGIVELRLGEKNKALQAFEEAVRVRQSALGHYHPHVAVSLVKVGITLMMLKRLEDSLWIFRDALAVRQKALGAEHPSTARIYNNIGCVHVECGQSRDAKIAFEGALLIQRKALEKDPNSGPILFGAATTLQNMAYLYRQNGRHEKEAIVLRESFGVRIHQCSDSLRLQYGFCLTYFLFCP